VRPTYIYSIPLPIPCKRRNRFFKESKPRHNKAFSHSRLIYCTTHNVDVGVQERIGCIIRLEEDYCYRS
jgi:hypothetical protein